MRRAALLSSLLAIALLSSSCLAVSVQSAVETPARIGHFEANNNDPDDPAIWANDDDLSQSLVIATLKRGGMDVYNLDGVVIQHIEPIPIPGIADNPGRFNNVDIVFDVEMGDDEVDLAVVSDRNNDMLRIFAVSSDRLASGMPPLYEVTAPDQGTIFNTNSVQVADGDFTSYGLAVSQLSDRGAFAFVTQNDRTGVAVVRLDIGDDEVGFEVVAKGDLPEQFTLPDGTAWSPGHDDDGEFSHAEGVVVDDTYGVVYFAQEKVGIWRAEIGNPFATLSLVDTINQYGVPYTRTPDPVNGGYVIDLQWDQDPNFGSDYLIGDVEGLTLYTAPDGTGYLLASSQGSNEYVVYDRVTNQYIGNFKLVDGATIDGVQETDGAAVSSLNFGGQFSSGLFVVQDGNNTPELVDAAGNPIDNANFKFVPWGNVASALDLQIANFEAPK